MKKLFFSFVLFFVLAACQNNNSTVKNLPNPPSTSTESPITKGLTFKSDTFSAQKGIHSANCYVDFAQGDSPQAQFINNTIYSLLLNGSANGKMDKNNYQQFVQAFVKDAFDSETENLSWSYDAAAKITYSSDNFICLSVSTSEMQSGMSSEDTWNTYHINMNTLQTVKKKELFTDNLAMRKLVTAELVKKMEEDGVEDNDYLTNYGEHGTIFLPDIIEFSLKELTFTFWSKDLFADDEQDKTIHQIFIPLAQVQPFLKVKL